MGEMCVFSNFPIAWNRKGSAGGFQGGGSQKSHKNPKNPEPKKQKDEAIATENSTTKTPKIPKISQNSVILRASGGFDVIFWYFEGFF